MDDDLEGMEREQLVAEVRKLRAAYRQSLDEQAPDARSHDAEHDDRSG